MDQTIATVESIGVNGNGDSVIRMRISAGGNDRGFIEASTNVVSFARLAGAGVRVVNEFVRVSKRARIG